MNKIIDIIGFGGHSKVILDIAKEIINKINALYGSKLRQSYLNNRNRGISKLKKVPGKLQDVSVAAVQYFYDKLFKNTDPPDRLGWNVNNYESRTAAKAKSQSKSGLFKKEKNNIKTYCETIRNKAYILH